MSEWATEDYEPTAEELQEMLDGWREATSHPGGHGEVEMIPAVERYIWEIEGVYWGHRRVEDGVVKVSWLRPY